MIKKYPVILITLSFIGLIASSILMNDTVKIAENPATDLPCNINPLLSCGNAILSQQGQVFGFPNPILGIISFSLLFGLGLALLLQTIERESLTEKIFGVNKYRKIFWSLVNLGALASVIFAIWFAYESIFVLRTLCIYCMVVWAVTWPIFLYTTIWNIKEDHFCLNSIHKNFHKFLQKNHKEILLTWYIVIIVTIIIKFKDFFIY